jgi:hypothetical protein
MKIRKHLSASGLYRSVSQVFAKIKDQRAENVVIALKDALMSGFAMFSLKDCSLLAFDQRRQTEGNMERVYGIEEVPSDTQMRTILDEVEPDELRPVFKEVIHQLQRGKELEKMVYLGGYLVSMDGTLYFTSRTVYCCDCLERKNKKTGEISYSHQALGAAIVHPERREVIPLPPEPIIKQDGTQKNDCERNAAKRLLSKLRHEYPRLPFIVIEDALSSNAPHIGELKKYDMRFILGVKEGDHPYLFEAVRQAEQEGCVSPYEVKERGVVHRFRFLNQVPLNASNPDVLVNFVEYWEIGPKRTQHFSWVTDFKVSQWNVMRIMRAGRARWKIENETFNTLKNQGYHFEHNYGHGNNHLSVVFMMLMMLAFLVDQTQQLACSLFQAVLQKEGSRKNLWEHMRNLFHTLDFECMEDIWRALLYGYKISGFVILDGT